MADTSAHDDISPAMDYAQHNATYRGFLLMVKWGIIAMAFVVVALYAFIEMHNPAFGTVLLLLGVAVVAARVIMGSRR